MATGGGDGMEGVDQAPRGTKRESYQEQEQAQAQVQVQGQPVHAVLTAAAAGGRAAVAAVAGWDAGDEGDDGDGRKKTARTTDTPLVMQQAQQQFYLQQQQQQHLLMQQQLQAQPQHHHQQQQHLLLQQQQEQWIALQQAALAAQQQQQQPWAHPHSHAAAAASGWPGAGGYRPTGALGAAPTPSAEAIPHDFHMQSISMDESWCVRKRYHCLKYLSKGAFGQVAAAMDNSTTQPSAVAIKRLIQPFNTPEHAKRTYREVLLLAQLQGDERNSLLQLLDVFSPQSSVHDLRDVFIVTEKADATLQQAIHQIKAEHVSYFAYRLIVALKYLHAAGVIHRDLKPTNIAVWGDPPKLKLLDFGLARVIVDSPTMMSTYVQTRYYRAPEVIVRAAYSTKADMWSVGCILAECFAKTIFLQGKGERHNDMVQMAAIVRKLGLPPPSFMDKLRPDVQMLLRKVATAEARTTTLHAELAKYGTPPEACDLIAKLLVYDADERWSAADALEHPYLARWRHADAEPDHEPKRFDEDQFERMHHTVDDWKQRLLQLLDELSCGNEP